MKRWLAFAALGLLSTRSERVVAQVVDASVTLMRPQGKTRTIDFWTDEGTEISVTVSPDGRSLAFDLLGQIYRLPMSGGEATTLTQNSGPALNFHPAFSPDGRRIAFISDRQGQNNVWVMNADGTSPRPVFIDLETRFVSPAWAPDGKSIVAVRVFPTPGRGWHRQTMELWRLPLAGGKPVRLLGGRLMHYDGPAFSRDGRYLYYHISYSTGEGLGLLTAGHRIQRLELATGKVENVRTKESAKLSPEFIAALKATAYASDVGIDPPAALMPAVSADGGRLAFALEEPDQTFSYRGHEFKPRTALYVRDLATGVEKRVLAPITKDLSQVNAQYAYRLVPGFQWTPDGRSVVLTEGGKLRRVDVETGTVTNIPFRARVLRVIGEQPRSRPTINDSTFDVKFLQWPAGSPDGKWLAFVAAGKIWVTGLPGGAPRPLTHEVPGTVQLTPAWSPDGLSIAFATWHDRERGHVWTVSANGSDLKRITREAGEYYQPGWTADGRRIVVTKGAGPRPGAWNGWNGAAWTVGWLPAAGGAFATIAPLSALNAAYVVGDRVAFQYQQNPAALGELYKPFPPAAALAQEIKIRSIPIDGGEGRDVLRFPPRLDRGAQPILSPDGKRVAYQSDRLIYVMAVPPTGSGDSAVLVATDPNVVVPGRTLIGRVAGAYPSWRDDRTLQFASGDRYVTYDVVTRRLTSSRITLQVARPAPGGSIALVGAKIITIDSGRVIPRGTVIVKGARIVCVGVCDTTGVDRVLHLEGKVVMPGLVDMHAHHTSEASGVIPAHRPLSALDLAYGVTAILDPSVGSESIFPLAAMIDADVVMGPRTFSTAELVIHPGYAWGDNLILHSVADAAYEVNRRADWGAVSIKNFRQSRRAQNEYIVEAARRRGITVTGEGGPLTFDVGLTIDGQTGWEHLLAPLPIYSDASRFFGKAGMVYNPTYIVAGHVNGAKEYFRPLQRLLEDAKYGHFMPRAELERRVQGAKPMPKDEFSFPMIAEGLADIVRAGGYGSIGDHGEQPGIGSHWEIWASAEALTPLEALTVATIHGAYFIGLQHQLGSITRGKLADLIVLNSDPLENIKNTADIAYVMKGGRLYDDDTLDEIWPEEKPFGPVPWQ
ncbi:MAG: amidohydrolase family protein [Gemmatimonadota bacterium]